MNYTLKNVQQKATSFCPVGLNRFHIKHHVHYTHCRCNMLSLTNSVKLSVYCITSKTLSVVLIHLHFQVTLLETDSVSSGIQCLLNRLDIVHSIPADLLQTLLQQNGGALHALLRRVTALVLC